ncbi:putative threonine-tRNA ligase [Babesia sp. Xinjiang]|uniref:putative threonine-tRNA ligase n=1 Tax=Babesia sp. Xinjiang TaxID=462227 RepID=UPI000A2635CE|nr:putative threonine-tRNA ligase [Babesia sp. Xinjiang]ORM42022.1 putative threonine-tRNA ligase [Babesia sp. Xinjiang]
MPVYNLDNSFFVELRRRVLCDYRPLRLEYKVHAFAAVDGALWFDMHSFYDRCCRFEDCACSDSTVIARHTVEKAQLLKRRTPSNHNSPNCKCVLVPGALVALPSLSEFRDSDVQSEVERACGTVSIDGEGFRLFGVSVDSNIWRRNGNFSGIGNLRCFVIVLYMDVKACVCHYAIANPVAHPIAPWSVLSHSVLYHSGRFEVIEGEQHVPFSIDISDIAELTELYTFTVPYIFFAFSRRNGKLVVANITDVHVLDDSAISLDGIICHRDHVTFAGFSNIPTVGALPRHWCTALLVLCHTLSLYAKVVRITLFELDTATRKHSLLGRPVAMVYEVLFGDVVESVNDITVNYGYHVNSDMEVASGVKYENVYNFSHDVVPKSTGDIDAKLRLQMMSWRIVPELKPYTITDIRVCVIGVGSLGCHIVRQLLAWGVGSFVLIDYARVTNGTRQCLYNSEDVREQTYKAVAACSEIKRIRPDADALPFNMLVPMPGHFVAGTELKSSYETLSQIMLACDAVFLSTDSKESRWLPSLIGAACCANVIRAEANILESDKSFEPSSKPGGGPLVVSTGLAFDSFMIVRHGYGNFEGGCYFCSDVQSPNDTISGRPIDETCTLVKPGVVAMCAATAVELLIALTQHPDRFEAPHASSSCLGGVPHAIHMNISVIERKIAPLFHLHSTTFKRGFYRINTMAVDIAGQVVTSGAEDARVVKDASSFRLESNPDFIKTRLAKFEELYERQQNRIAEAEKRDINVEVEIPDKPSAKITGKSWITCPADLIKCLSKADAQGVEVAEIRPAEKSGDFVVDIENDTDQTDEWILWDLHRPLEGDCTIRFHTFDSPKGQHVFWHSSAHMLGSALETLYGAYITIGPALSQGFYYDCYIGNHTLKPDDMEKITAHVSNMSKIKSSFQRLVCSKNEALELMKHNPFKVELIRKKVPDGSNTVCYRCGDFVDLCRGPHLPFTTSLHHKAFAVTKFSSCYWLSKNTADTLQRVYGISFPKENQLKEYERRIEEAKTRDHRIIGTNLNLFHFDNVHSPGSCFWLPNGAKIYNRLVDFMRENYRLRGYQEVITPNIFSCELWKTSGHYDNYKENMYMFTVDELEWGMKGMNCPGHCLMFKHMNPSYRQLPLRLADFGVLHRNELTGSLSGLTRVRRFQQDDAHVFCTTEQIGDEVLLILKFIDDVYSLFNFKYSFKLSTKPTKALGDDELWNKAESGLKDALEKCGRPWTLNPGDGAFYGPKIDVILLDSLEREHQCGTVQLDFNLPIRFNLGYRDKDDEATDCKRGFSRPVIIHRAIFGSVERFIAIVIEHLKGKLPFWLSPTQVAILPISDKHLSYSENIYKKLLHLGYNCYVDSSANTMNKKIKLNQAQRYNYMLIIGDREVETVTVSLRTMESQANEILTLDELYAKLEEDAKAYKKNISCFHLEE